MKLKTIAAALVMTFATSGAHAAPEKFCESFEKKSLIVAEYYKDTGYVDSSKLIGSGSSYEEQMTAEMVGGFVTAVVENPRIDTRGLSAEGISKFVFSMCIMKG